jgi:hypothetical protein
MMEDYYQVRLTGYETRKALEIKRLERELVEYDAKARFLLALLEGRMDLRRKSDEAINKAIKRRSDCDLLSIRQPNFKPTVIVECQAPCPAHLERRHVGQELCRAFQGASRH